MTTRSRTRILSAMTTLVVALGVAFGGATPAVAAGGYSDLQVVEGAPIIPDVAAEYQGLLYVSGWSADVNASDRLYTFDGTSFTLIESPYYGFTNLRVVGDLLYFTARDDNKWYLLSYDGTSFAEVGPETTYSPIDFVGYDGGVIVSVPMSGTQTDLSYFKGGVQSSMGTFDYVNDLAVFAGYVYFTGTPFGGSGYQMDRTDGVVVQEDLAPAGYGLFAWKDALYMGDVNDPGLFSKMYADLTHDVASDPAIAYPSNFLDAGDVMYLTGDLDGNHVVFSYDGTEATPLPVGPTNVGTALLFDGSLWVSDIHFGTTVCAADVTVQCDYDYSDIYYLNGTEWVSVAQARSSNGFMVVYQGRLYVQDAGTWTYTELASLPNTGLELAPMVWVALLALAAGGALMVIRRRNGLATTD